MLNPIDYNAYSPLEEWNLAFDPTPTKEDYSDFCSWKGRAVCLVKIGVHAVGIVIKPLYYLFSGILMKLSGTLFENAPDALIETTYREKGTDLSAYKASPELRASLISLGDQRIFAALVAPFSQIIQMAKATMGVISPNIYFAPDELERLLQEVATEASAANCSQALIDKLHSETIYAATDGSLNQQYYLAQFRRDLSFIIEQFAKPEFSTHRKFALLSLLNPEPEESGIEACAQGLGRILQQICSEISAPENPEDVIPWLENRYKEELINTMVMRADTTRRAADRPEWHKIIHSLGPDYAHRGNALVRDCGELLNLRGEMIERARRDPMISPIPLSDSDKKAIEDAFWDLYDEQPLEARLLETINSQPDGTPGLKSFRQQVIQALSETIQESDDPAMESVKLYTLNAGVGNPSDIDFGDLNEAAITSFLKLHPLEAMQ